MTKKSKRIELENDVIERLTIKAVKSSKDPKKNKFKPYVENQLIKLSKK